MELRAQTEPDFESLEAQLLGDQLPTCRPSLPRHVLGTAQPKRFADRYTDWDAGPGVGSTS